MTADRPPVFSKPEPSPADLLDWPSGFWVEITPTRFGYDINAYEGLIDFADGPWRFTRRGAMRKARRMYRKRAEEARRKGMKVVLPTLELPR